MPDQARFRQAARPGDPLERRPATARLRDHVARGIKDGTPVAAPDAGEGEVDIDRAERRDAAR
jgi:hypothetical protein